MRTHGRVSRHLLIAGFLALTPLGLVACGTATVTSDDVEQSTTMPSRAQSAEKDAKGPGDQPRASAPAPSKKEPRPKDQAAREVKSIPPAAREVRPEDEAYLAALRDAGVSTDGVEDQLIGTAGTVCSDSALASATPGAVAGQLIEQGRATIEQPELTRILERSARESYCD